ncbi:MAG: RDD family protein [Ilumatobacteraceae bacterium]
MFGADRRTEDEPVVPAGMVLAPVLRRAGALLLDQLIVLVPIVLVALVSGVTPGSQISEHTLFILSVTSLAGFFVYSAVMVALLGRTVGKIASGLRIVRAEDGGPVGWTAAVMRALVPLTAGVVPTVGFTLTLGVYGFAVFGPLRQGLHDRAAGTLVVLHRPRPTVPPPS